MRNPTARDQHSRASLRCRSDLTYAEWRLHQRDPNPVSIVLTVLNKISRSSQGEKYLM